MRTAVDFFVSLLFGQAGVAIAAIMALYFDPARRGWLGFGALAAIVVMILSYRGAVITSDEWCFAVQALLNVGRKPLAEAFSLRLPKDLEGEQNMWRSVGQFLRPKPLAEILNQLDYYRAQTPPSDESLVSRQMGGDEPGDESESTIRPGRDSP